MGQEGARVRGISVAGARDGGKENGMNGKNVLICVLTYNNCADTLACLASLMRLDYEGYDILVIDNGSTDASTLEIARRYPGIEIVRMETNMGAAAGRNVGIERALQGEYAYVFFVDNDAVVEPSTLTELTAEAERDDRLAAVGAMTYYSGRDKCIWHNGGRVCWRTGRFSDVEQGVIDSGQFTSVKYVDSFPIGFGIVRTDAIRRAGMIDERYFIYYEEADWHARMRKDGYCVAVTPRAKIFHKVSSSLGIESPEFYYYRTRNRLLFMRKNATRFQLVCFSLFFLYDFLCNTLLTLYLSKKNGQFKAALWGVCDFLRGRFGKCPHIF